ncbi:MAG: 2-polyprenyl-3-methyl-6-methoxy-1,4-benzoquinone monooxygenase [Saccharospirillaceae bacterium]|nr:2-polyprenyl-3-methyl-6-methoxy-1,4-benzoquinone monooxygenase [Pseudomonadales bacterium]NRB81045.1 2-polyprenyl-3-methyl-6-methoxy-1,4-benzoquinone monooxygenase [Saccharospirillaceae bacterium]
MLDKFIIEFDKALKVSLPHNLKNERQNPSKHIDEPTLSDSQRKHSEALMRINHTGEVMAQAMYQGQALTAKSKENKTLMQHAAIEEIDHLTWCKERLDELNGSTSIFNPLWYALSFSMGALAGKISDEVSLGFVAAVEDQVCIHLEEHLDSLPANDNKSSCIVKQMLIDEEGHSKMALDAGGKVFTTNTKKAMTGFSKAMTFLSYRI